MTNKTAKKYAKTGILHSVLLFYRRIYQFFHRWLYPGKCHRYGIVIPGTGIQIGKTGKCKEVIDDPN